MDIESKTLKNLIRENMTEVVGTKKLVKRLRKKGYKLGILSVHAKEWVDYCEANYNYQQLFHTVVYSCEVGVCKPESQAFEMIIEKFMTPAHECLFVDDSLRNIEAAQRVGMQAIQFKDAEQLKSELRKLGITI